MLPGVFRSLRRLRRRAEVSIFINGEREVLYLAPNAVLLDWLGDEKAFKKTS